jgi:hypothetical protein
MESMDAVEFMSVCKMDGPAAFKEKSSSGRKRQQDDGAMFL